MYCHWGGNHSSLCGCWIQPFRLPWLRQQSKVFSSVVWWYQKGNMKGFPRTARSLWHWTKERGLQYIPKKSHWNCWTTFLSTFVQPPVMKCAILGGTDMAGHPLQSVTPCLFKIRTVWFQNWLVNHFLSSVDANVMSSYSILEVLWHQAQLPFTLLFCTFPWMCCKSYILPCGASPRALICRVRPTYAWQPPGGG